MADIRPVTDDFAVAPQLTPQDAAEAAARGYRLVINNRPDGEAPGQPLAAEVEKAVRAAGLDYVHIPISGPATPDQVEAVHSAAANADGPVLAFCRSGTRCITVWSRGQLLHGDRSREALVALGQEAGYDLSGLPH